MPSFQKSPRRTRAVCVAALLALSPAFAVAEVIETGSDVAAATVYPRGATITREAAFAAPAGRHSIVIDNLPIDIDAESLRVEGAAAGARFSILGLNYRVDRPTPEPLSDPERERLEQEIRAVRYDIQIERDAIEAAEGRRVYAEGVREATLRTRRREENAAGPGPLIDDVDRWRAAWELLSDEIAAAQRARRDAEARKAAHERALDALLEQLDATQPEPPRGVLTVAIQGAEPIADGLLSVRYLTRAASWSPLYDLRLAEGAELDEAPGRATLTIVRRAAVRQSTGEDWRGAALTLSTARPTGRLEAPRPPISQASIRPPEPPMPAGRVTTKGLRLDQRQRAETETAQQMDQLMGGAADMAEDRVFAEAPAAPAPAQIDAEEASALASYQGAAAIYRIAEPVDVPGDGEIRQARIGAFDTEVETEIRSTPARDPNAYLYAMFPNADAPLPPGRASLYRGEAYLGQLNLPYVAPGETKPLAFGRAEEIQVERRIRDRSEGQEGVFTTSNRRQSRFEITVRNLGARAVSVRLFDSLPYTEDERIKIALNAAPKPSEQDVEGRRGALAWDFPLPAGGEKSIAFSYTLSWPEGETLDLLGR
ncbi:MAG: DUF4139 domain-containing protein [Pseudomonadota bacterium]